MISAAIALLAAVPAFSSGSPICEVNALPLVEMSSVLASPAPAGWRLNASRTAIGAGSTVTFGVSHPDTQKRLKGIMVWVKREDGSGGVGSWQLLPNSGFQFIPAVECGQWSFSHNTSTPKTWQSLSFAWTAPQNLGEVEVEARAFIIEDCVGSCRSFQALTNVVLMTPTVFKDGFE